MWLGGKKIYYFLKYFSAKGAKKQKIWPDGPPQNLPTIRGIGCQNKENKEYSKQGIRNDFGTLLSLTKRGQ